MDQSQLNKELYEQCTKGHLELVKYLVKQGADLEAKSLGSYTSLNWVSRNGKLDLVKFLVEAGSKLEAKRHWLW